ncbi:MAG: hypothetical protein AB7O84_06245 [Planctomycetota bacterium]
MTRASPAGTQLRILGIGAVTSVGLGAASTAAAVRAGISRARETALRPTTDPDHAPVALMGHTVAAVDGFVAPGRNRRLAAMAVRDLLESLPERATAPDTWQRTGLLVCAAPAAAGTSGDSVDAVVAAVRDDLALAVPREAVVVVRGEHAAAAAALLQAGKPLAGKVKVERWLLVAVDSLVEPSRLEQLLDEDRVKHDDNPVGVSPGEGAAALLLTTRTDAAAACGLLFAAAGADAPVDAVAETTEVGRRVAAATRAALQAAGAVERPGDAWVDLTGEPWRAQVWGNALVRGKHLHDRALQLPIADIGDLGAATGAVLVCLAVRSFARGHAGGDAALIVTTEPDGSVAALVVRAAEGSTR